LHGGCSGFGIFGVDFAKSFEDAGDVFLGVGFGGCVVR
jgi:hypothetical protein